MDPHILNGLILIFIVTGSEGVYYNGTTDVTRCQAMNRYGCVIENECCFYFVEKSSCFGYCNFEMELDPHRFAPKQVNQSCCAPVAKRYKKTVLWCKGEADIPTKKVDPRFPGWYYEEGFQYTVATQCDCVGSDWQNDVRYDSPYVIKSPDVYKPEETEQPEEQFLTACMEAIGPSGPQGSEGPEDCFDLVAMDTSWSNCLGDADVPTLKECFQACLSLDLADCGAVEWYTDPAVSYRCIFCFPSFGNQPRSDRDAYLRTCPEIQDFSDEDIAQ